MSTIAKPPKDSEYLSTLERGLKVLRAFDANRPMQFSEVAAATAFGPAVRRCLNTLVQLGCRRHGRKLFFRPEVLVFGSAYLLSMNVEQIVMPSLQRLRDPTGDSSSMAVLSNHDILYVAHVSTDRHVRLGANVGTSFSQSCHLAWPIAAGLQAKDVIAAFRKRRTDSLSEHTIVSTTKLSKRLQQIEQQDTIQPSTNSITALSRSPSRYSMALAKPLPRSIAQLEQQKSHKTISSVSACRCGAKQPRRSTPPWNVGHRSSHSLQQR